MSPRARLDAETPTPNVDRFAPHTSPRPNPSARTSSTRARGARDMPPISPSTERRPLIAVDDASTASTASQHETALAGDFVDVERAARRAHASTTTRIASSALRMSVAACAALVAVATLVTRASDDAGVGGSAARTLAYRFASTMSLDEQLTLLGGQVEQAYIGSTSGFVVSSTRAKVPELRMNDGPQGFRAHNRPGTTTQWPCALAVAATFDVGLAHAWGGAMGGEFVRKGANVFLGPGMNLARVPLGGRNFEYIAGEDPALGSAMAPAVIRGIQSRGVIATAKHFIFNEQERDRMYYDAQVDERTMREMYLPMFEASIKDAEVGSIMCSYNKVNGSHACQNSVYMNEILRDDLGFEGFVMSDWLATHSTVPSLKSGLDMEMPTAGLFSRDRLKHALETTNALGKPILSAKRIKVAATRVLTSMFRAGIMDEEETVPRAIDANVRTYNDTTLARNIVAKSAILLKNDGNLLPLDPDAQNKTIITFGAMCAQPWSLSGGGSGHVDPGAKNVFTVNDGLHDAGQDFKWYDEHQLDQALTEATKMGDALQAIIVCDGAGAGESLDRPRITLHAHQQPVSRFSEKFRKKIVIIVTAPGHVVIPQHADASSILLSFLPGEQAGLGLADVVFGKHAPGGKLPITIPNSENELGNFDQEQYPGTGGKVVYKEGLHVGYRWYNAKGIRPAFHFGHGLTYTTFKYADALVETYPVDSSIAANVSFSVTNTGDRAASEVVQVYVTYPRDAQEPPRQLKAFKKIVVAAGHTKQVSLALPVRALQIWSTKEKKWSNVPGEFSFHVGGTSELRELITCDPVQTHGPDATSGVLEYFGRP